MEYLLYFAMLLLLGTLCSALADKLKISSVFFLMGTGMILGYFDLIDFSTETLIAVSTIALILVLFDSTSKLRFKEVIKYSPKALRLVFLFLIFCVMFIGFISYVSLGLNSVLLALLFSVITFGTDTTTALEVLKVKNNRIVKILEIEAIMNTPITVILSLALLAALKSQTTVSPIGQGLLLISNVLIGLCIGAIVGLLMIKILKSFNLGLTQHLALMAVAVISYILAESIGGSGVLAVTVFGLIFGNSDIEHKQKLEHYTEAFSSAATIFVFILIGTTIFIDPEFILKGTFLFIIYLSVRFLSLVFAIEHLSFKERLFMTLNVPKGIDEAILALILMGFTSIITGLYQIVNIILLFMLYSIILSTVSSAFTKRLLGIDENKK